jgi:hypothetical protein
MKKSLLVPAVTVLGICIGCNTGADDVNKAETEYKQAQRDGDQMVADARREGIEETHETRKVVLDDINAEKADVMEAEKDVNSTVAEERADVDEAVREGNQDILDAEAVKQKKLAEAKIAAAENVADAKRDLETTKRKAVEDSRKRIVECEDVVKNEQRKLTDAKAEVAAAETRLKGATDEDRPDLQRKLEEAQQRQQKKNNDVAEANVALAKENATLKAMEAKVN